jgi:hypothetical protein
VLASIVLDSHGSEAGFRKIEARHPTSTSVKLRQTRIAFYATCLARVKGFGWIFYVAQQQSVAFWHLSGK